MTSLDEFDLPEPPDEDLAPPEDSWAPPLDGLVPAPAPAGTPADGNGAGDALTLSDQLSARIGKVTGTLLSTQIKAIAETQLAELLTPEIYQRIEELSRRRLAAELETQLVAEAQAAEEAENPPTTVFGSTEEFVRVRLAPGYRRDVVDNREIRWCPQWWRHEEAISRLEALWRTWEHFRRDPTTGMSVWWRDHADHHMSVLMSSDGPFSKCSAAHGHHTADNAIAPLPTDPAPAGMFPDTREL
jgi:hypothetical protein